MTDQHESGSMETERPLVSLGIELEYVTNVIASTVDDVDFSILLLFTARYASTLATQLSNRLKDRDDIEKV